METQRTVTVQLLDWSETDSPQRWGRPPRTGHSRPVTHREWLALERNPARRRLHRAGARRPIGSPAGRTIGAPAPMLANGWPVAAALTLETAAYGARRATAPTAADRWAIWHAHGAMRPADRGTAAYAQWLDESADLHAAGRAADVAA